MVWGGGGSSSLFVVVKPTSNINIRQTNWFGTTRKTLSLNPPTASLAASYKAFVITTDVETIDLDGQECVCSSVPRYLKRSIEKVLSSLLSSTYRSELRVSQIISFATILLRFMLQNWSHMCILRVITLPHVMDWNETIFTAIINVSLKLVHQH